MARMTSAVTSQPEIFVARSTGVIKVKGQIHRYIAGRTRIPKGHALLRAIPDAFEPMKLDFVKPEA